MLCFGWLGWLFFFARYAAQLSMISKLAICLAKLALLSCSLSVWLGILVMLAVLLAVGYLSMLAGCLCSVAG
jgi:hypothetical protein